MHTTHLNEHDANQGAQSSGEFLGMTGNSGWYLLGSGGATIMMVVVLWGILGVSLLLCLLVGVVLCVAAVAYVFALKNNKPAHFDTDFFESALVEAGVLQFSFGPRYRRPVSPFSSGADVDTEGPVVIGSTAHRRPRPVASTGRSRFVVSTHESASEPVRDRSTEKPGSAAVEKTDPLVAQRSYEQLQEQLATTEELLEDALDERGED